MDGFIFVNKPVGPSSFAVIQRIKPLVNRARIGHAGTLDPAASGLLIVAVGKATRLLEYVPVEPKCYTFTLHFGAETDTLDNEGSIVESGGPIPGEQALADALPHFTGTILQEPPRFSAIKINGERAYARARNNEAFDMKPRQVTVYSITMDGFDAVKGAASIAVGCSSGTYVRSLARDIARALKTFGFATNIHRTALGPFTLSEAKGIDVVTESIPSCLVSIHDVFSTCPCVIISEAQKEKLAFGADIQIDNAPSEDPRPVFGFDGQNKIVAVLVKKESGLYHPEKVFLS
jgi:tRNA pseudouridine55 synthase